MVQMGIPLLRRELAEVCLGLCRCVTCTSSWHLGYEYAQGCSCLRNIPLVTADFSSSCLRELMLEEAFLAFSYVFPLYIIASPICIYRLFLYSIYSFCLTLGLFSADGSWPEDAS